MSDLELVQRLLTSIGQLTDDIHRYRDELAILQSKMDAFLAVARSHRRRLEAVERAVIHGDGFFIGRGGRSEPNDG